LPNIRLIAKNTYSLTLTGLFVVSKAKNVICNLYCTTRVLCECSSEINRLHGDTIVTLKWHVILSSVAQQLQLRRLTSDSSVWQTMRRCITTRRNWRKHV